MFVGYIDYIIFSILIFLNIKFWRRKFTGALIYVIIAILFGILLPMVSMKLEIIKVKNEYEIVDGFNLLYTLFRFPMYWILGIWQVINLKITKESQQVTG